MNAYCEPALKFDVDFFTGDKPLRFIEPSTELNIEPSEKDKSIDWQKYLVINEPPEVPALISINEIPICTPGNHSLIIGKKKSRKTLFLAWLIWQYSLQNNDDASGVLICDTEQGERHVWKSRNRIYRLTNNYVNTLSLRGLNPKQRREVIEAAIQEGKFKIVVIDGIRDLLSNINDPDQCTELVTWIENLTVTNGVHIINVLHQNKVDNNARGHIGSELLNKAEITIELELDEKSQCTIVKCESSRDVPFESFAFSHSSDGLPEVVNTPIKGQVMSDDERKSTLEFVFEGELLKYKEAINGIKEHFEVGITRAEKLLKEFQKLGWIVKNGRDRSPDAVYKLMIGSAITKNMVPGGENE